MWEISVTLNGSRCHRSFDYPSPTLFAGIPQRSQQPGLFDLVLMQQIRFTCPRTASYRCTFIQPPSLMAVPLILIDYDRSSRIKFLFKPLKVLQHIIMYRLQRRVTLFQIPIIIFLNKRLSDILLYGEHPWYWLNKCPLLRWTSIVPLCCPLWDKVAVAKVPQQFVSSQVGARCIRRISQSELK